MQPNHDFSQLKRLSIFATVVDQGSFAAAANILGLSRPAVSEQVAQLEKQIGTRLLHRTTRKLSLTTDGENLYPHAANINRAFNIANESIQGEQLHGRVRLTTTVDFAIQWLIPRLQIFQQQYPDIEIDLISGDETLDLVAEKIDLALRIGLPKDANFIARPIHRESLKIYAAPNYLIKQGEPKTITAAERQHWVLLTQIHAGDRFTLWNGKRQANLQPSRVWHSNSPAVLMAQIQAGLGLGMAFPMMVDAWVQQGLLIPVLPKWHSEEMTFSLVYASRRQMPARVRVLRDFLLQP